MVESHRLVQKLLRHAWASMHRMQCTPKNQRVRSSHESQHNFEYRLGLAFANGHLIAVNLCRFMGTNMSSAFCCASKTTKTSYKPIPRSNPDMYLMLMPLSVNVYVCCAVLCCVVSIACSHNHKVSKGPLFLNLIGHFGHFGHSYCSNLRSARYPENYVGY